MTDTASPPSEAPPTYAADFVHELFWEQIKRMFVEELTAAGTKMGSVAAVTSKGLLVLVDGTAIPRDMERTAGRSYAVGQRVIVARVQGKPVVVGGVLTGAAGAGVIGTADLASGAVLGAMTRDGVSTVPPDRSLGYLKMIVGGLRGSAVDGNQSIFQEGSIGSRDIGAGEITNPKIATVAASKLTGSIPFSMISGTIASGQIGNDVIGGGNIAAGSIGNSDLQDDSIDRRTLGPYAVGTNNLQGGGDGQPGAVTWQKLDPTVQAMLGKKKKNKNAAGQVISISYIPERPRHSDDD